MMKDSNVFLSNEYALDSSGKLSVAISLKDSNYEVELAADIPGALILHWGIASRTRSEWLLPPPSMHPSGTTVHEKSAAQTPFVFSDGKNRLTIKFSEKDVPLGITFVLIDKGKWIKKSGRNFFIPVSNLRKDNAGSLSPGLLDSAEEIINAETGHNSWTLMHRFNLCYDLLDEVEKDREGFALLFVWLRYSALRQLDWQRNYNTKPRELSHAQDRLTIKLCSIFIKEPENRDLIMMMLATLGRGGEGQKIRDEILQIMHRHHIKEVSGHFMEEWHQKLHNNTTPDDIVICEAYIEFLKSSGNHSAFYSTLEAGGVTRTRLESFERPIRTQPDFVPHLKDALIHDFSNFLRILKSVHSGTDLESSANSARYLLDGDMNGNLRFILENRHRKDLKITDIAGRITFLRRRLRDMLNANSNNQEIRSLIYLDLSLEEFLRVVVERSIHKDINRDQLVEFIGMLLENMNFTYVDSEFSVCLESWNRLKGSQSFTVDWALHAKSVLDRSGRAIADLTETCYRLFQPKAEFLGRAFNAESWTISLFTEELVRGRPAFVLSMLIHHIDPILRRTARLGDWQVISPGHARGHIDAVEALRTVQGKVYNKPTVIIADEVKGDEEPPAGVSAVITPASVDLVSHIAVRARNAHLLFATCYDKQCLDRLKEFKGQMLDFTVSSTGDIVYEEVSEEAVSAPSRMKLDFKGIKKPEFSAYAITSTDFREGMVGGKSRNLNALRGRLPDWINLPASAALPFGVFEKVFSIDSNRDFASRYKALTGKLEENTSSVLSGIRKLILEIRAPNELFESLLGIMKEEGLQFNATTDKIWDCIKRVWGSKWNERAYLSRKTLGISHDDIFMAVLVQEVIEAEYSFVIHTVNPLSGNREEIFAEVVKGLGEALVGNYPGRALGFISAKDSPEPRLVSYPGKSTGLFGKGLIFRSDSNGEDLSEYSGAGLYDSVMLEEPEKRRISYADEPLVWDEGFRTKMLTTIAGIGAAVEKAAGFPQDIEGVYSKGKYYVVQTRPQVGMINK